MPASSLPQWVTRCRRLVRHGAGHGWKAPWRDLLIGLRRHPDTDVRQEAYAIEMSWPPQSRQRAPNRPS